MQKFLNIIVVFTISGLVLLTCHKQHKPLVRTAFQMDTLVRISVFDPVAPADSINLLIDHIFEWMEDAESKLSVHRENSDVQRINQQAGEDAISVSDDVFRVIRAGKELHDQTSGAFDITIGVIKSLWDFHGENPSLPEKDVIQNQLRLIDNNSIVMRDSSIILLKSGMQIDLGGIAKGYVVDKVVEMLEAAGVKSAIVEAGGDLRLLGNHPDKKHWRIGIRHPRILQGIIGLLDIDAVSVTTSGDYERYFIQDSVRYHHILDPVTGYPARGCISVTVVTLSAMIADGLATALFVMGPEKAIAWTNAHPDVDCIVFYEDSTGVQYKLSDHIKSNFTHIKEGD